MHTTAYASAPNPDKPGKAPGIGNILPMMIVMFVIIYFFMIRPQTKRQRETKQMLEAVKKGDKVITAGGILGLVTAIKGNIMTLKISSNTEVDFKKSAVSAVVTPEIEQELKGEKKK
jgi:preprotein translocase subunit YajC